MSSVIATMDSLIEGPALEPLDLEEVKKQRRFTPTTLDTLFDLWSSAARQHFEEQTGRQVMLATREYWMDAFPCQREIELPHPPLHDVLSITYDVSASAEATLAADQYRVHAPAGEYCSRGRISLVSGASWPTAVCQPKAVRIRYRCGWGPSPGDVPELVKATLLFLVGHFHKYGEEVQDPTTALVRVPLGAEMMIRGFAMTALPTMIPTRATWQV